MQGQLTANVFSFSLFSDKTKTGEIIASSIPIPKQKKKNEKRQKKTKEKYSNKLSMKALVEKHILMKKEEIDMRKTPHFFMYIYQGNSRELKGTQGNSRELRGTQGNSRELKVFPGKRL